MKILVISPDMRGIARVRCYTDVWSHYLPRELEAMGAEIIYSPMMDREGLTDDALIRYHQELPLDGIDHILALGLRYFTQRQGLMQAARVLQQRIPGAVTQFHDRYVVAPVDCTFFVTGPEMQPGGVEIGWAADEILLRPMEASDEFSILIDHPNYTTDPNDLSERIVADVRHFIASGIWYPRWQKVSVRRLVDGGAENCDLGSDVVPIFHRRHISFEAIAAAYPCHVFLPTHKEAVGLTALETAMCGALVVSPQGFIPKDRLTTIRAIEYEGAISWDVVLASIDADASRVRAVENSWSAVGIKVWNYFTNYKRFA